MQLTIQWEEILKRFPPIEVVEKPKRAIGIQRAGLWGMTCSTKEV
jgi:hypothetical protein